MSLPSWPTALPAPLLEGYRLSSSSRKYATEMETGRKRLRRQFEDLRKTAEVQWTFTEDQFYTFRSFFQDVLQNGTLAFTLNLYGQPQEVRFLQASFAFDHSDNLFRVSSVLEIPPIVPIPTDLTFTYSLNGVGYRDTGNLITFGVSLNGAPVVEREK